MKLLFADGVAGRLFYSISIRSEVLIGIVHLKMILFYYYLFAPKVIPFLYDFLFFSVTQKLDIVQLKKNKRKKERKLHGSIKVVNRNVAVYYK